MAPASARRSRRIARAGLCAVLTIAGCAAEPSRDTTPALTVAEAVNGRITGDFAGSPAAAAFVRRMRAQGFAPAEVERLLSQARREDWIIAAMDRANSPASARPTGAWLRYRAKFLTADNIARGGAFWRRHAATLARAASIYGVPAEYVVAILGVETRWGGYLGSQRILDALATLAFAYPRRSAYFADELAQFLVMARDEGIDPRQPVGSFAGAMGLGQFMPSSFHRYAVDFDGDRRRDLWDAEDAIGSVAHYFARFGWRRGEPVAMRAPLDGTLPAGIETGFKQRYPVTRLRALGFEIPSQVAADAELRLLRLDMGTHYEYWFGFDNFYVITRYNHSTYYAMAVHQLAHALRARAAHD